MSGAAKRGQRGLGRGLSALIGDGPPPLSDAPDAPNAPADTPHGSAPEQKSRVGGTVRLPVASLRPNPDNPRRTFDDDALDELAQSIRQRGILQPLLVRDTGDGYVIIAGERRWRAAQKAGIHEVPVVMRRASPAEAHELALIENVQRSDLNAIEEADGYRRLMEDFGHTQEALAKVIGKSRSHVANTLRLLALPPSIRASVADGSLSAGHARALIGAPNAEALADTVIRKGLSVRATEALVAAETRRADNVAASPVAAQDTADTRDLVRRLSDRLGLTVNLSHKADESGTLTIRYTNLEQLESVCRRLGEG